MQGVTRSQDPELGPAVSKYPPSSGYGDSHARTHTYGHMHRDQQFSSATPEAVEGLYPSGFPRHGVTPRKHSRTADRRMRRFQQDPDLEVKPVVPGVMVRKKHVMTKTSRTCAAPPALLMVAKFETLLQGALTQASSQQHSSCVFICVLQTDAEARTRAEQGPLFKPKTPEYEYELSSRHRKAENQALAKIQHRREEQADIPKYDEAGQQVAVPSFVYACVQDTALSAIQCTTISASA